MIEIVDGVFVNPRKVAVIKEVDKDKCALFTSGQSAVDGGFLIDRPAIEVAEEIANELEEQSH